MSKYYSKKLHPIQFDELTAQLVYNAHRMQRTITPLMIESEGDQIVAYSNISGFSSVPWFGPWVQKDYAKVLAHVLGLPLKSVFHPPDKVTTWLKNERRKFFRIDINDEGWP